jgi:hypothetical protein
MAEGFSRCSESEICNELIVFTACEIHWSASVPRRFPSPRSFTKGTLVSLSFSTTVLLPPCMKPWLLSSDGNRTRTQLRRLRPSRWRVAGFYISICRAATDGEGLRARQIKVLGHCRRCWPVSNLPQNTIGIVRTSGRVSMDVFSLEHVKGSADTDVGLSNPLAMDSRR